MSHPHHLTSSWSSAFIPFCAFMTNLSIGDNSFAVSGINFPLCSSFLPTILEGQLCYKLTLNATSGQGKENELMLLLDFNEDRSLQTSSNKSKAVKSSNKTLSFATAVESLQGGSAKIQINTLSPYISFSGGIYMMTVVKRMTAKKDFLKMPLKDRNCEVELYEDCRTRKLFEECKCIPWEAPGFQVHFVQGTKCAKSFVLRTWRYVAQRVETALRGIPRRVSTAAQLVKGSMLTSSGLERKLKRWKMEKQKKTLKQNLKEKLMRIQTKDLRISKNNLLTSRQK